MTSSVRPSAPCAVTPQLPAACVVSGGRHRTIDEIRDRALRAAGGFKRLGLGEGGTVALLLRNDFPLFEATLGATSAGAYPVPLNWHGTAEEVGYILRDSGARILIAHSDLLPGVAAGLPDDVAVFVARTPPEIAEAHRAPDAAAPPGALGLRTQDWDAWLQGQEPQREAARAIRAAVIYTSGTTGRPKGVRRAPNLSGVVRNGTAAAFGFEGDEPLTVLMNGPMYHSAPNSYGLLALNRGARIVLQPRFDAEDLLALVERWRVTHMHIVPTMLVRLLRLPDEVKARYDLSSLRHVVHGAAPCPSEVKRAMIDWWGPVIHEYYGSTETGLITSHDSGEALRKPGTVGRVLPGVTLKVVREGGGEAAPGEAGDVFVHTTAITDFTYIGMEEQRAAVADGRFVTVGDIGYVDEEGFLFLCDRRRDMVISGGVNIYPAEIEAALLELPGVADCAVFGIPDPEFGEAVCAHVQTAPGGPDAAAIRVALGRSLSRFKLPKVIEIAAELPREDSGKIFKRKLREPYWAGSGRTI